MRLIDADELLRRYDEEHEGEPGRARKLIEEAPTVSGWIRVKDRLPENDNPVLTWESQGFAYVDNYRKEEKWRKWQIGDCYGGIITHWMPLPEPPKEESNA